MRVKRYSVSVRTREGYEGGREGGMDGWMEGGWGGRWKEYTGWKISQGEGGWKEEGRVLSDSKQRVWKEYIENVNVL